MPAVDASGASGPGPSVSAPSDDAVTSPDLDSSRLYAAFGAAIGAVDVGANEGDIDVKDTSAAKPVPPPYVEGGSASVNIPGVNLGTSSLTGEAGKGAKSHALSQH